MKIKKVALKGKEKQKPKRKPKKGLENHPYLDQNGDFKKGNPGKPEGAIHVKRRFIERLLNVFGEKEAAVFKKFFGKPDDKFLRALDRIITATEGLKAVDDNGNELPPFQLIIEGAEIAAANRKASKAETVETESGKDLP